MPQNGRIETIQFGVQIITDDVSVLLSDKSEAAALAKRSLMMRGCFSRCGFVGLTHIRISFVFLF
jgi:hypothetical protein